MIDYIIIAFGIAIPIILITGYCSWDNINKYYKAIDGFKKPKWAKDAELEIDSNGYKYCKFTSGKEEKGKYRETLYFITDDYKLGKELKK